MAQHDYNIANQSGAAFRADLNNALLAIVSQNSGASEPSTTFAYQWWADTTTNLLKLRNAANSAWITLFQLDGEWSTIAVENGTAGAPSIYFKDSGTDTGFYSPGADQVAISTGGTGRLFIDSSGRLGLGTSSPTNALHVVGSSDSVARISATSDTNLTFSETTANKHWNLKPSAGDFYIQYSGTAYNSGFSNLVTIKSSGAVGIGTTSVASALDVRGADHVVIGASPSSGNGEGSIFLGCVGTGTKGNIIARSALTFQTSDSSTPVTSGTERARIDSSGRLLVGTSTSASTGNGYTPGLQVAAQNGSISAASYRSDEYGGIVALQKSRSATVGTQTVVSNNDQLGLLSFEGSDGTNFEVAAQIQAYVDGTPGANDMPGRLVFSTTADGASSPTERMRINNAGEVLIGATAFAGTGISISSPEWSGCYATSVGTGSRNIWRFANANGVIGAITTSGSATSYATSSDYRLKENVVPLTGAADRVNQLQVYRFNFIADPNKIVDGFIAHEAQAVVPECVTGEKDAVDEDGNPVYQGIDQSKLVPLLTAALQEALAKIETLEARLTKAGI